MVAAEEGQTLGDNEIRDQIVSMITAGYETTSAPWPGRLYTLLSLPGAWDGAADEVNRVRWRTRAPTARTSRRSPTSMALCTRHFGCTRRQ